MMVREPFLEVIILPPCASQQLPCTALDFEDLGTDDAPPERAVGACYNGGAIRGPGDAYRAGHRVTCTDMHGSSYSIRATDAMDRTRNCLVTVE